MIVLFLCSALAVTVEAASLPEEEKEEEELEEEKEGVGANAPGADSLAAEGSLCPFRIRVFSCPFTMNTQGARLLHHVIDFLRLS
jgi:hypothetical protein